MAERWGESGFLTQPSGESLSPPRATGRRDVFDLQPGRVEGLGELRLALGEESSHEGQPQLVLASTNSKRTPLEPTGPIIPTNFNEPKKGNILTRAIRTAWKKSWPFVVGAAAGAAIGTGAGLILFPAAVAAYGIGAFIGGGAAFGFLALPVIWADRKFRSSGKK